MSGALIQVFYNRITYRWEVWESQSRLPARTHPSKDVAVLSALELLSARNRGRIVIYGDSGSPETVLKAERYQRPGARTRSLIAQGGGTSVRPGVFQPRGPRSEPPRSRAS